MPTTAMRATELGRSIEAGLMAEHRLANGPVDPSLAGDLRAVAAEGRAASEQLIRDHLPMVDAMALQYAGRGLDVPDLVQEGRIGLIRAVAEFDHTVDDFATIAPWWIRRAMVRAITAAGRDALPTRAAVCELGLSPQRARELGGGPPELVSLDAPARSADPDEIADQHAIGDLRYDPDDRYGQEPIGALLYDPDDPSTEALALAALESAALAAALIELGDPAARVVRVRFGLGPGQPMSLSATSRVTGLTPERVRQCEARAIRQLRDRAPLLA